MDYLVELDTFRGPPDLLLYLVKRNEVDVCDIPIARIADQFLEYLLVIELIDFSIQLPNLKLPNYQMQGSLLWKA